MVMTKYIVNNRAIIFNKNSYLNFQIVKYKSDPTNFGWVIKITILEI